MIEFTPHSEKQERALFSKKKIILLATGIQYGKGIALDTPVLTFGGYKKASDITYGDKLIDRTGKSTLIVGIYKQGLIDSYELAFNDQSRIIFDKNHIHIVKNGTKEMLMTTLQLFECRFCLKKMSFDFPMVTGKTKTLTSITNVGKKNTICFEVSSKTKSYTIKDDLVTHNTTCGAVWTRLKMHEHNDKKDNFLITAPSYKILKQSSLPSFLSVMGNIGSYSSKDDTYSIPNGPTVYFRTNTHPDSVVGITNVRAIWCDEAGKYSLYFWENIQARSSFKAAPIILTTSPYSLNWVYKDLISSYQKGKRHDEIELIQAASYENPYFPKEEYDRKRKTMDERRFKMIYGGEWLRQEGIVYDCFDQKECEIKPFLLPLGTKYYGGIDWGYRDPFCLLIRAITPYGYKIDLSEVYKSNLRPSQILDILKQKHGLFGVDKFFADPSRPDLIQEFQMAGIPIFKADNDIQKGIDCHYQLIKSGNYKIFEGTCPNLINEYDSYHYAEDDDLLPDQNSNKKKELPVDQDNHACDAARYLSIMTQGIGKTNVITVPSEKKTSGHPYDEFQKKLRRRDGHDL